MRRFAVVLILLLTGGAGCSGATAGERPDGTMPGGRLITDADIERTGAVHALEAIERSRHHLSIPRNSAGEAAAIRHRGRGSLSLDTRMKIVVDGVPMINGLAALRSIPSHSIRFIQLLSAREATVVFGSAGGNGAIVVRTGAMIAGG